MWISRIYKAQPICFYSHAFLLIYTDIIMIFICKVQIKYVNSQNSSGSVVKDVDVILEVTGSNPVFFRHFCALI